MPTLLDRLTLLHEKNPDPDFIAGALRYVGMWRPLNNIPEEFYDQYKREHIALWREARGFNVPSGLQGFYSSRPEECLKRRLDEWSRPNHPGWWFIKWEERFLPTHIREEW